MDSSSNEDPPRNHTNAVILDQTSSPRIAGECSENKDSGDSIPIKSGEYTTATSAHDGKDRITRIFYPPSMMDVKSENKNRENRKHRKKCS